MVVNLATIVLVCGYFWELPTAPPEMAGKILRIEPFKSFFN